MAIIHAGTSSFELQPYEYADIDEPWVLVRLRLRDAHVSLDQCGAFLRDCELEDLAARCRAGVAPFALATLEEIVRVNVTASIGGLYTLMVAYHADCSMVAPLRLELSVSSDALLQFGTDLQREIDLLRERRAAEQVHNGDPDRT